MSFNLSEIISIIIRYLMTIELSDVLDVSIMAYVVYRLLLLVHSTKAASLLKGLFVFFAVMWTSSAFQLEGITYILDTLWQWGVLALVILFQPEIRRGLEQMGSRRIIGFFTAETQVGTLEQAINQTVLAATEMSKTHTGILVVFEREILLDDSVRSGTVLDAEVSAELLKNIFFVKAPMHDGAVIVRNGRILGAGCMLPLTRNENLSRDLGMRHRAGIGMSENSDAVVVIVSEETGSISVSAGGMLKRHLQPETLGLLLRNELLVQEEPKEQGKFLSWLRFKKGDNGHE